MTKTEKKLELSWLDCKPKRIWVRPLNSPEPVTMDDGVWVLDTTGKLTTHCPADRCGGPFGLSDFVGDEGDKFFLFAVVDSYFPIYDLVRADSFESAYEVYCDFACDNRHCEISAEDLPDYLDDEGEYQGSYTSDGKPVDTDNIQGSEVQLWRLDF